ncbi:MAG: TM2 domain-containing protein [Halobacteriales archaeon]
MSHNNPSAGEQRSESKSAAEKSVPVAVLLGLTLSPLAYYYVGKTKLAILNLITLNWLGLGIVATPIHTYKIIDNAESGSG